MSFCRNDLIVRRVYGVKGSVGRGPIKDYYLIKYSGNGNNGVVDVGANGLITFPMDMVGKRIRIKIEEIV